MATAARSLSSLIPFVLVAMCALATNRALGQNAPPAALPAGVTACRFDAFTDRTKGEDQVIRDAPRSDARVLGHLPLVRVTNADSTESRAEIAQFRVIGFKDGWFLIEDAHYPDISKPLYSGQGWVEGKFVTINLYRDTLKKAPSYSAADVVDLTPHDRRHAHFSLRLQLEQHHRMFRAVV